MIKQMGLSAATDVLSAQQLISVIRHILLVFTCWGIDARA
jgi:hypothetical protein